jgi:alpha-galactosidase
VQGAVVSDTDGLMVMVKPLSNGDRAIALYNATDALATIGVPAADAGLRRARGYRLYDVWSKSVRQARSTISAAVPAHGTVVLRVRPLSHPEKVPPSVTVGAELATLIPGGDGGTLTSTVTNRGAGAVKRVRVTARAPDGWTVTATGPTTRRRLGTDASLRTTWTVRAPDGTAAGRYPIALTASYAWGPRGRPDSSTTELVTTVVTAPAAGRRHLSTVLAVSSTNARGPVEADQSNGGDGDRDGALITIGGRVYTRGLGTTAPSEIVYYLGGQCSRLVTDVGIDDEAATTIPATFTVYADDVAVADSGPVAAGEAARTLTADLTGAAWLRLVTAGSGPGGDGTTTNDHADWAAPVLTCGDVAPDAPVLPAERTLFSFESGTEDWVFANPEGGSVAQSPAFHTHGEQGLNVLTPTTGNWFGKALAEPLDLTGTGKLKFDVKTGATGTTGEIAIQVGPDWSWCQGGLWAWTNPNSSRTIAQDIEDIECSVGVTKDLSQVRAIWVFLNGGDVHIDNVRAEAG